MNRHKTVLTTGEVAAICNVAPRTVSKWFDSGQLKGYRVPGSRDRRIPVKELARFMRNHGMPAAGLETGTTRILVIDRDLRRARALVEVLGRHKYFEARAVDSAFAAGRVSAGFEPHVILLDTALPDVRPADFASAARRQETCVSVKLVAVTSESSAVDRLRSQGFDGCLVSPIDMAKVVAVVDEVCSDAE